MGWLVCYTTIVPAVLPPPPLLAPGLHYVLPNRTVYLCMHIVWAAAATTVPRTADSMLVSQSLHVEKDLVLTTKKKKCFRDQ